jgi:phosphatidylinositol alpha-mannosyltransferase
LAAGRERRKLATIISRSSFDVIHYHAMYAPVMGVQAFCSSLCANVATLHDTPPDTFGGAVERSYLRQVTRWLLPRLDGVIAVSTIPAPHYDMSEAARVRVLPPCVDLRRFTAQKQAVAEFQDDRLNILFVGRLTARKGAIFLLQAYARLCKQGVKGRLLIVGDGPERSRLERFCTRNGAPHVVFLGERRDTPRWYATCDVFCSPPIYGEAFGIVVAEAMASGKPIVATNIPAYRRLLTGEARQFVTPPADVDALLQSLHTLAGDANLRRRLGAWGRREAGKYDCGTVAKQIVSVYEEAAGTKGRNHFA